MVIEKNVMQTWKTKDVPEKWKESPESIKKLMPNWTYTLMTDEDNLEFVKTYFPDFYEYFVKFPHNIQRADAIRYMWLYVNGGIYMDLDYILLKSLNEFFENNIAEIYLAVSGNSLPFITNFTNSVIAGKKGSIFWLKCVEAMKIPQPWYYTKHFEVFNSTGPSMVTKISKETNVPFIILPSKLFNPCDICNKSCMKVTEEVYLKPLEGGTWNSWDSKTLNWIYCNFDTFIFWLVMIIMLIILFFFIRRK